MAVYAALEAERAPDLVGALGGVAAVVLGLGLVRKTASVVAVGLAGLGAAYAFALLTRGDETSGSAPFVAAGMVAAAELAYWSLEQRAAREEAELVGYRFAAVAATALAGLAAAAALLVVVELPSGGGTVVEALGVVAAVVTLGLVVALARVEE